MISSYPNTKNDRQFIGWCGLKYRPEQDENDLGYRLKQNVWGKGYTTEAAQYTLDHGFNSLQLKLITGRAHIEKYRLHQSIGKIGMKFITEGIVDDCPVRTYQ